MAALRIMALAYATFILVPGSASAATASQAPECRDPVAYGQSLQLLKNCRTLERAAGDPRGFVCLDGLHGSVDDVDKAFLNLYCTEVQNDLRAAAADIDEFTELQARLLVTLAFTRAGGAAAAIHAAEWRTPNGALATLLAPSAHTAFLKARYPQGLDAAAAQPYDGNETIVARASDISVGLVMSEASVEPVTISARVFLAVDGSPATVLRVTAAGRFSPDAATPSNLLGLLWTRFEWSPDR